MKNSYFTNRFYFNKLNIHIHPEIRIKKGNNLNILEYPRQQLKTLSTQVHKVNACSHG